MHPILPKSHPNIIPHTPIPLLLREWNMPMNIIRTIIPRATTTTNRDRIPAALAARAAASAMHASSSRGTIDANIAAGAITITDGLIVVHGRFGRSATGRRRRFGPRWCRSDDSGPVGGQLDQFGVTVPFSASGIAAPAVLTAAAIVPLKPKKID